VGATLLMTRAFILSVVALIAVDMGFLVGAGWEWGWWAPLSFGFVTGVLGLLVIAYASWRFGSIVAIRLDNDECLTDSSLSGLLLMVAGFMLLLPGPIIDALGFALLFPSMRSYAVKTVRKHFRGNKTPKYA